MAPQHNNADAKGEGATSACQLRHREMEVRMAYDLMSQCSELEQAERIAQHYLGHTMNAQYLLKIMSTARYGGELSDDAKAMVKHLADRIRNNHALALGIKLDWPHP